jgi:A/G-specific adenine glycosylase
LGYYSRARNLHEAAKSIVNEHHGVFPDQFEEIRKLKGVGDYTAAAIASFAFNLPFAVVDGNVYRFLSRIFGVDTPIDSTEGKKQFAKLARQLLDEKNPGTYNQAIMEFGAIQCKPNNPNCSICPFNDRCVAYREDLVSTLPVKSRKGTVKIRYFNYLMVRYNKRIYMSQRKPGDIWGKLYELPLIESNKSIAHHKLMQSSEWKSLIGSQQFHLKSVKDYPVHKLSHQHIHTRLFEIVMKEKPKELLSSPFVDVKDSEVFELPVSRLMESILTDHF